ncbi:MAG: hypothetical protein ACRD1E_11220 [Terriglobales bacterium]
MKLQSAVLITALATACSTLAGVAQTPAAPPQTPAASAATQPKTVGQRKENQQDRIGQGVASGQLTAGETKSLEGREAGLNAETRDMRADDSGHLTAADRAKLNRQQNRLSNSIYTDKHNLAQQRQGAGVIGQRGENQQDRIANGIKNGTLSPAETARLEKQQQGTNREVAGMREANGGKLTAADKKVLNQQQNKNSRRIYKTKHDGRGR